MKSKRMKIQGLAVAAAALLSLPATAQESAKNERQFPGQLDSKSPKEDDHPYQVRTIALEAGKRYAFSAEAEDFDPALRLSLADDNDEELANDDDGGEGMNSYLEYVPARSATYRLRVSSVNSEKGSYLLKVRDLPPLPALQRPKPVSTSTLTFKHYTGELSASDAEIRTRRIDDYSFRFEAGKQVLIFMDRAGDDLDPLLEVYAPGNRNGTDAIAEDDDGGDGLNAFVLFTPEETGEYIVRATSSGQEHTTGAYQLRVGQHP